MQIKDLMEFGKTITRREKYSEIKATYWEATEYIPVGDFIFTLQDPQTFATGGEVMIIPITSEQGANDDTETRIEYTMVDDTIVIVHPSFFPVKGDKDSTTFFRSMASIFGTDDNNFISPQEFTYAGGDITLNYNTENHEYEVHVTPPSRDIGVNSNFSLSLEGSIAALTIWGAGTKFTKKSVSIYTQYRGQINNVLEIDLPHVSDKNTAYNSAQRLLEKYSFNAPEYSLSWTSPSTATSEEGALMLDGNIIIPQTLSVRPVGDAHINETTTGFPYIPLMNWMFTNKTIGDHSFNGRTLHEIQYYINTFLK